MKTQQSTTQPISQGWQEGSMKAVFPPFSGWVGYGSIWLQLLCFFYVTPNWDGVVRKPKRVDAKQPTILHRLKINHKRKDNQ